MRSLPRPRVASICALWAGLGTVLLPVAPTLASPPAAEEEASDAAERDPVVPSAGVPGGIELDDPPPPDLGADLTGWNGTIRIQRCDAPALSLPADTERAMLATRLIRTSDGMGSAVVITPDGYALTAAHVVEGLDQVIVRDREGVEYFADVVRVDRGQDIALIKIVVRGEQHCLAPLDGQASLGSDIFVLGSPAGEELSFSVSKGIVSGYRAFEGLSFVQVDASINPGNSGGPAVDSEGRIVGIASFKVADVSMEGLAFAVEIGPGLHALGLMFDDESTVDWRPLAGYRWAGLHAGETDDGVSGGAPTPPGPTPAPVKAVETPEQKAAKRRRSKRGLMISGGVGLGLGATMVIGTGALNWSGELRSDQWGPMVGINTAGWVLAGTGAGLLVLGLALPKKNPEKGKDTARVRVAPTLGGVTVGGRF